MIARLSPPSSAPILFVGVLWLCCTSRWGSYVAIPGTPVYVGDLVVAAALAQTIYAFRRDRLQPREALGAVFQAPLALLMASVLVAWSFVRGLIGFAGFEDATLTFLRDLAPYAYGLTALLAFLVSTHDGRRQRTAIFVALTLHVVWVLEGALLQSWLTGDLILGGVEVFTPRPDFDSAVLGVAVGLSLHEFLHATDRSLRRGKNLFLLLFAALNAYALNTLLTRAGLLAGMAAVGAVIVTWGLRTTKVRRVSGPKGVATVLALVTLVTLAVASPPGQRLVDSVRGEQGASLGTVQAREFTWSGVSRYVLADAGRTAVGVGFGDDFLAQSGTTYALQGEEYENVRSPHNYVIGTFARLGLFGALVAVLVILLAGLLALRHLTRPVGAVTTLASLLVITVPVTALLGVVLESPFGAIPYFWAVGHISRVAWETRRSALPTAPTVAARETSDTSE